MILNRNYDSPTYRYIAGITLVPTMGGGRRTSVNVEFKVNVSKYFSVASPRRGKLSLKATEESDEREVRAVLAAWAFPRSMGLVEMFASTFLHLGFRVLVDSCDENIPQ